MSQSNDKKAREREHLHRFLSLQGLRPEAIDEGDPLDFVLDCGRAGRVGVELVGVDDAAQLANNVRAEREIAQKAEAALRKAGHVIQVQLIWKVGLVRFSEDPKRLDAFLGRLMTVINKEASSLGEDAFVLHDDEEDRRLHDLDLAELSTLAVQKMEHLTEPQVLSIPMAWAQGDSGLLAALRDKEGKLPEYRRRLGDGDVWLLIVTGARFEQNVHASLVKERSLQSTFDRVFLLDLREDRAVALK